MNEVMTNFSAVEMRIKLREIYEDMRRHAVAQLTELNEFSDCEIESLFESIVMTELEEIDSDSGVRFSLN